MRLPGSVARAVGQANAANLPAIVLPCHRVIAADGSLGGYAGGLERRRRPKAVQCHDILDT